MNVHVEEWSLLWSVVSAGVVALSGYMAFA